MKKVLGSAAVVILAATLLAACSSSPSASNGGSSTTTTAKPGVRSLGDSNPANADASGTSAQAAYTPTGNIVANDGFDHQKNNFGFQNYGNILPDGSTAHTDMTPQTM
ncbi:MAG: hypothetical protein ACRDWB_11480, partial [Acidimicrobiales bacterium]